MSARSGRSRGPARVGAPQGLAVDTVNNELLVANANFGSIQIYSRTASGDAAPLRTIQGATAGMSDPRGLAVDTVNNEVLVTNFATNSIRVYSRTADGDVAPVRTIQGGATGLARPTGLAVDTVNNEVLVLNADAVLDNWSITVYSRTASGNGLCGRSAGRPRNWISRSASRWTP